jgi:hypothetical protein
MPEFSPYYALGTGNQHLLNYKISAAGGLVLTSL